MQQHRHVHVFLQQDIPVLQAQPPTQQMQQQNQPASASASASRPVCSVAPLQAAPTTPRHAQQPAIIRVQSTMPPQLPSGSVAGKLL